MTVTPLAWDTSLLCSAMIVSYRELRGKKQKWHTYIIITQSPFVISGNWAFCAQAFETNLCRIYLLFFLHKKSSFYSRVSAKLGVTQLTLTFSLTESEITYDEAGQKPSLYFLFIQSFSMLGKLFHISGELSLNTGQLLPDDLVTHVSIVVRGGPPISVSHPLTWSVITLCLD